MNPSVLGWVARLCDWSCAALRVVTHDGMRCGSAPAHEQRARRTAGRRKLTLVGVWFKLFKDRGYVGLSSLYVQKIRPPSESEWLAAEHRLHGAWKWRFWCSREADTGHLLASLRDQRRKKFEGQGGVGWYQLNSFQIIYCCNLHIYFSIWEVHASIFEILSWSGRLQCQCLSAVPSRQISNT
jgi:hypothetical protein